MNQNHHLHARMLDLTTSIAPLRPHNPNPPPHFTHLPGEEIPTKHKEAIRQLYGFAKIPVEVLSTRYKLGRTTIERVLDYEHTRITGPEDPLS